MSKRTFPKPFYTIAVLYTTMVGILDEKRWQRSNTGMYHNGRCNGAVRLRPLYLSGEKLSYNELIKRGLPICKKCIRI
jgi:hypothetical protein